ncbi:17666_t:CDS:1, partial [Funneliformis geosporum]
KPVKDMILSSLLQNIQEKCEKFVASFIKSDINILSQKLSYNKECKESDEKLAEITLRILNFLNDS